MIYTWKSYNIEGQVYINNKAAAFFFKFETFVFSHLYD